jgi:hypothetical protein
MCNHITQSGLNDMELMNELEEMGYDFRNSNQTLDDVINDSRPITELSNDDFNWLGAYEMAINEGYRYCECCDRWYKN